MNTPPNDERRYTESTKHEQDGQLNIASCCSGIESTNEMLLDSIAARNSPSSSCDASGCLKGWDIGGRRRRRRSSQSMTEQHTSRSNNGDDTHQGKSKRGRSSSDELSYSTMTTATTTTKRPEDVLAEELSQLNFDEMQRIYEEVHGIVLDSDGNPILKEPTQEAMEQYLQQMDVEIATTPSHDTCREAYDIALREAPHKVNNPTFRQLFLRSEEYCPKKAARRIINYFKCKKLLFGPDKLVEDITLDNCILNDHGDNDGTDDNDETSSTTTTTTTTKEFFMSGAFQTLQSKDRSGRTVFLFARKHCPSKPNIDLVRP